MLTLVNGRRAASLQYLGAQDEGCGGIKRLGEDRAVAHHEHGAVPRDLKWTDSVRLLDQQSFRLGARECGIDELAREQGASLGDDDEDLLKLAALRLVDRRKC